MKYIVLAIIMITPLTTVSAERHTELPQAAPIKTNKFDTFADELDLLDNLTTEEELALALHKNRTMAPPSGPMIMMRKFGIAVLFALLSCKQTVEDKFYSFQQYCIATKQRLFNHGTK